MPLVEVRTLVCGPGADAFRIGDAVYPCDSEWISAADAAEALDADVGQVLAHVVSGGIPTYDGWVSLSWIRGIRAARDRAAP